MNDEERVIYSALVSVRNADAALRWTRTQILLLLHSGALSLVIAQDKIKYGEWLHIGICAVGTVLVILWLLLTWTIQKFIIYWDDRLNELEKKAPPGTVRVFGGRSYWKNMRGYWVHNLLLGIVSIFLIVWLTLLTLSVLVALKYLKL